MSLKDCILAKAKSKNHPVTEEDAKKAADIYDEELAARGSPEDARNATIKALARDKKARKYRALKSVEVQQRIINALKDAEGDPAKFRETILSLMDQTGNERVGFLSAEQIRKNVSGEAHSAMRDFLAEHHRNLLGQNKNKAGLVDIVREAFGGNSGNANAKAFVKAWQEATEVLRLRFNKAGGDIMKHPNWGLPTRWNEEKLLMVPKEKFVSDMLGNGGIDWDRISQRTGRAYSEGGKVKALQDMYDQVTTKGHVSKEVEPNKYSVHEVVAARHAAHRFLEFKDGDSWLKAQEMYGSDDIFATMVTHIDSMAREIGAMEALGPSPEATLAMVQKYAENYTNRNIKTLGKGKQNKILRASKFTQKMYEVYTGANNISYNPSVAKTFSSIRAFLVSAQLGGAFLSATSDLGFQAVAARFAGVPLAKSLGRHMKMFAPGSSADRQLAIRLGLIADTYANAGAAQARYIGEVPMAEWATKLSDGVLGASGLMRWTQAGRHAFGLEFMGVLADESGKVFNSLRKPLQKTMKRYNITPDEWEVIRKTELFDHNGAKFLAPLTMKNKELGQKVLSMILTETEFAVPSSSLRGRTHLAFGEAGSPGGELLRSAAMYKSFSVTLMHTHMKRWWQEGWKGKVSYGGQVILATTMMGALAMQMKDVSRGRKPRPMFGEWAPTFWLAAMAQGGGLGIFGDFITSDISRFGQSLGATVAGPVLGIGTDVVRLGAAGAEGVATGDFTKAAGQASYLMGRYSPASSLWYTRLLTERAIFDQIQHAIDPKAEKRWRTQRNNYIRDKGQEYFMPRGELTPQF